MICQLGHSQTISVSSFKILDTDLTANTAGTMEVDQNGETAALIKVVTTQTGFSFDGGALGIVKTVQKPSEIWVYVPKGLKKITISHPQLGMLRDYYLNMPIEAARTYEMTLVTDEIHTIVKQTPKNQYLVIKVTPPDAIVELDNEILPISNGIAQKFVKFGTYDYRVQAKDYHTTAGKVTIDDPNNKKLLEVNLKPAFGWIEIPANEKYNGAQVYIDNTLAGTIPMKSGNLSNGLHSIKIVKDLYYPYFQTVTIEDNKTTQINPILSANYSEIAITVDNDAEIYINEEKRGIGVWNGKLAPGNYVFEAKKEGHKSTRTIVELSNQEQRKELKLATPTPVYGQANITSNPSFSDVYIDDKIVGQTPLFLSEILTGNHQMKIQHDGFQDYKTSIYIYDNKVSDYEISLIDKKMAKIDFRCNLPDAIIFIDDVNCGTIEKIKQIQPGFHNFRVVSGGFKDYEFSANVLTEVSNNVFNIKMVPDKSLIRSKKKTRKWF